ncbi:hypothetical protein TruAng_006642 [Truncatella angustata]|nr:hypothetical protein TruAng_006642 [Truncatella angustata]
MYLREQAPTPDSSLRNGGHLKKYDGENDNITLLSIEEDKKRKGGIVTAEEQAETSSRQMIEFYGLQGLYSHTTTGTKFRTWYMDSARLQLEPLHGSMIRGDARLYIDKDADYAEEFMHFVELIKRDPPLCSAPTLLKSDNMQLDMEEEDEIVYEEEEANEADHDNMEAAMDLSLAGPSVAGPSVAGPSVASPSTAGQFAVGIDDDALTDQNQFTHRKDTKIWTHRTYENGLVTLLISHTSRK